MNKKFDIRRNPRRLTSQQIARHKNFDALLKKFQTEPRPRPVVRRMIYMAGAVAAALAGLFFFAQVFTGQDYEQREQAFFAAQNFVNPPLSDIQPSFAKFEVNPNAGGVYEYPSGSKLIVPAAAFVNESGQTLEGEVTLHYREMHDFVDFFLSGIPMTYDSAGVNYNLESAGMIEIFAEQNGKRVNMAPGKSINVELVSRVNVSPTMEVPKGYNIYKLDTVKRNWVYQEIDRMTVLEDEMGEQLDENSPVYPARKELRDKLQAIQISAANEMAKIEASVYLPKEPLKPLRATGSDYVFDLDLKDLFPPSLSPKGDSTAFNPAKEELRQLYRKYEKMLWQLSPQANVTPERLQSEFSNVTGLSIRKLNNRDYELTLEKSGKSLVVIVNPVLSGSDYDKALAEFNKEYDVWHKQFLAREAQLAAQKEALRNRMDEERRLAQAAFNEKIDELRKQGLDFAATNEIIKKKVVNRFTASEFGIWNCDRPLPPEMVQMAATFKNENGKVFKNTTAYLVDKSRNTVYRFLAEDGTDLRFNKNSENLLWLVTEDNKIAVFRPEDFKQINAATKEQTFVLETVDKKIEDENDLREILYL
jgi:hypothetical protein